MNSPSSPSLKASREHAARTSSGYVMLVLLLAVLAFGVYFAFFQSRAASWIFIVVVCTLVFLLIGKGFYVLQPNEAAILLFGSYRGTDRATGLRWVWPWMNSEKVSVRANNVISDQIKVNDLRGNPIEIGGVAGDGHGAGTVRRPGLQGVRQRPDRGGGAHHRVALSLRRF
jgi:hypothetical protein